MKCPYCGTENAEDAKECEACKASFETPEVIEENPESNITLTLGNAQAQMQEAPKLTAAPLPVLEEEEKPKTLTEQFIEQKKKEKKERPVLAEASHSSSSSKSSFDMNRVYAALSYFSLLGFLISYYLTQDKRNPFVKTHLNQGLIVGLAFAVGRMIPYIGIFIRIAAYVFFILGVYYSVTGQDKKLPLIGDYELIK